MPDPHEIMPGSASDLTAAGISQGGRDAEGLSEAAPMCGLYRVTFKDGHNEAEPPRSEEFTARGLSAAKAEALRRSRATEILVDVVPLS